MTTQVLPAQQASVPPRRRRWFVWVALMALALFSIPLLIAWRKGSTCVEEAIARADRLDSRWRFDDLQADRLPVPPADKNGSAQIAAIAAAEAKGGYGLWSFPQIQGDAAKQAQAREAMDKSLEGERNVPALLNEEQVRVLKAEQARSARALALARDLVRFPFGRIPITYPKNLWAVSLANCQQARPAGRMLHHDALLRAHNGDLSGALLDVKAIIHAGRAVGDEPFLIAILIRIALDHVAVNTLERSLGLGEATDQELRNIQACLLDQIQIPYLLQALRGERAGIDRMLEAVQNGEYSTNDLMKMLGPTGMDTTMVYAITLYTSATSMLRRAELLELMTDAVEVAKLPTEQQAAAFQVWMEKIKNLSMFSIARLIVPALDRVGDAHIRNQAVLRTAFVGVAAERFRLTKHRWPIKLEELTPAYLDQVPVDPFDGQPLRMKQVDGSFIVYSIGLDRIDDHGQLDVKPFQPGSDIGFRLFDPAKRRQPAKPFVIEEDEDKEGPN